MKRIFVVFFLLLISLPSYAADQLDGKTDAKHDPSSPYQLKEVDQPPRILKSMVPRYPFEARENGVEGRVTLRFVVDKDGRAQEPQVVSSIPEGVFDQSALNAVVKYEFRPAYKNRKPVDCIVKLPIAFTLNKNDNADRGRGKPSIGRLYRTNPYITKAIELDPKNAHPYSMRGSVDTQMSRFDEVISDYTKAIELNPKDADVYYGRGVTYARIDQSERAINDFSKAIEINPEFVYAYLNRGHAYGIKGQYDMAISDITKAIEIDPDHAEAYNMRAFAYFEKFQADRAISDYSKAIEINPEDAYAYFNRGFVHHDNARDDIAISDYSKAIEINPELAYAYSNRGMAYDTIGNMKEACSDWKKACDLGVCNGFNIAKRSGDCE